MDERHAAVESHRLVAGAQVARRPRSSLRRRAALAVATAALATLALAAPALAATTIGQTGGDVGCGGPRVVADTNYVVPSGGGTITSFSYAPVSGNGGQPLDFLVLRPTTGSDYTVVGKTGLVTLDRAGGVETFAANISVQGGDILGFWHPGNLEGCVRVVAGGGGAIFGSGAPTDPSVGATVSLPITIRIVDLNESANLVTGLVTGPTSKNQCKRGGWRSFGDTFKNQGECVRLFGT